MTARLRTLLAWTAANGIHIDPSVELVDDPNSGIAVFGTDVATTMVRGSCVVSIPKTALLSVRSCALAEHIPFAPVGHAAHLSLALALYTEL